MTQADFIRIVVVYPQDARSQRDLVREAITELNQNLAQELQLFLRFEDWTTAARPGFHSDGPQGLIDSKLELSKADIVIALFYKRLGDSMEGARSGTEHEVLQAFEARKMYGSPEVMLYFCNAPPESMTEVEEREWRELCQFKACLPRPLFYWEYSSDVELASFIRNHLTQCIFEKADARSTSAGKDASFCWSTGATPTILRSEGMAERVADVDITFAGIPHGGRECLSANFDVQVYLSTNISNRLLDDNQLTDALLVLDRTELGSKDNWPSRTTVRGRRESMNSLVFAGCAD